MRGVKKKVKPRLIVTGAVSLLGKYLIEELKSTYQISLVVHHPNPANNRQEKAPKIYPVDISQPDDLGRLIFRIQPQFIIHLAAISNIDYCESHHDEAWRVNVIGTQNLCQALRGYPTQMIFASSNMIFSGTHPPYKETDLPRPVNFYGKTKAAAEQIVLALSPATVVRFTTLFGWPPAGARGNDVTYYSPLLRKKSPIYLVNDRFFNPVYAAVAARAVKNIVDGRLTGIFHVGGKDRVSRFTFVRKIAEVFGSTHAPFLPVAHDYFPNLAPRPKDATLDIGKMTQILQITAPDLKYGLTLMRKSMTNKLS